MLDGAGRKAGLRPRILIPDLVERAGLGSRVLLDIMERAGLVSDRGLEGSRLLRTAIGLDGLGSRSTAESTSGVRRGNTFRNGCEGAPSGRDTVGRRGVLLAVGNRSCRARLYRSTLNLILECLTSSTHATAFRASFVRCA